MKIQILCLLSVGFTLSTMAFSPLERAQELRRAIEEKASPFLLEDLFFSKDNQGFDLPVDPVFNQGSTPLCWAYAALHVLRTYYANAPLDAEVAKWRALLSDFSSSADYRAYITEKTGLVGGWPSEAILFMSEQVTATDRWIAYVPSTSQSGWGAHPGPDVHEYTPEAYFTTPEAVVEKIREGLVYETPSAFCTSNHCVTIYGGSYVNGQAKTYRIADSAGGYVYTADAKKLHGRIADITTRER